MTRRFLLGGSVLWLAAIALPLGAADDVARRFADPPAGFGMVPLYWWTGEPLSVERIAWELDRLKAKGFTGVQANFVPLLQGEFQQRSDPPPFTDAWWRVWEDVVRECKKRGMTLGIDDYGFHEMIWDLANHPELRGFHLDRQTADVGGGRRAEIQSPAGAKILCVRAYRSTPGGIDGTPSIDLSEHLKGSALVWTAPEGRWRVVLVFARPGGVDMSNPKAGQVWIDNWFQKFEDHSPGDVGTTLSYFFQDEFYYPGMPFWSDRVPEAFRARKGYDIVPELAALFEDVGHRTFKVRLDYHDVVVSLLEEGYFRPVYEWCQKRGAIYGHDNLRGSLVDAVRSYGDYFGPERWFQAPGSDRMPDLIIGKTCASIAQLYDRPRVWLEAYYGTGWGVSPENLFVWNNQSLMDGYNILSYHSLYYSTRACWWTWAPGDPHFRQPYWGLMDGHYAYCRRLCYLLSQGKHICDVAIVLPISTIQAGLSGGAAQQTAHGAAHALFAQGIDFDFLDDASVERANVDGKTLAVSGGAYRALLLPSLSVARFATIEKALAFQRAGGVVIAIGALPVASDRAGSGDPRLDEMVEEIFGKAPPALVQAMAKILRETTGFSQKASWIWTPEPQGSFSIENRYFRKTFALPAEPASARLRIACDNIYTLFLNGRQVGHDEAWETVEEYDVTKLLRAGPNVIAIEGRTTDPGWAGLAAELMATMEDGEEIVVPTDASWRSIDKPPTDWKDIGADDSKWDGTRRLAAIGEGPWGDRMTLVGAKGPSIAIPSLIHRGKAGGAGALFARPDDPSIPKLIGESIPRDFVSDPPVHVLHRRIGERDVYAVCNPGPKTISAAARFRAKGRPMRWDPWTGERAPVLVCDADPDGTSVPLSLDPYALELVVFDPGVPAGPVVTRHDLDDVASVEPSGARFAVTGHARTGGKKRAIVRSGSWTIAVEGNAPEPPAPIALDGPWEFELVPVLDNRYGDFESPPSQDRIGAEARRFRWAEEGAGIAGAPWQSPELDDSSWPEITRSFGPLFWALGPIPAGSDPRAIEEAILKAGRIDASVPVNVAGEALSWKPCDASLRWGIEKDPLYSGAYGTAANALGLKGSVPDALLDLTSGHPGSIWYVWTSLRASEAGETRLAVASPAVYDVWMNGARILEQRDPVPNPMTYTVRARTAAISLKPGANPLLLRFVEPAATRTVQARASIAIDRELRDENLDDIDDTKAPRGLLARRWYGRSRDAVLDAKPGRERAGWYRFRTPPGLQSMEITAQGKIQVWVGGRELEVTEAPDALSVAREREGATVYRAVAKEPFAAPAVAAIRVEHRPGFYGGAALPEAVRFTCVAGRAPLGDWSAIGLGTFSGQAWYRKTVTLSQEQAAGKVILDLGKVAVAARLVVNGKDAGTRIAPPWTFDISAAVRAGENRIEVLIANTLGSHCSVGVPDGHVFPGQTAAGLLGPVRIETWPAVTLR